VFWRSKAMYEKGWIKKFKTRDDARARIERGSGAHDGNSFQCTWDGNKWSVSAKMRIRSPKALRPTKLNGRCWSPKRRSGARRRPHVAVGFSFPHPCHHKSPVRAKRYLGYEPQFKLHDALQDLGHWMKRYTP